MKIISWNINGIRAWSKKVFDHGSTFEWILKQNPDFICLQESKCSVDQFNESSLSLSGYHSYINSSKVKKGYSGVIIYAKTEAPEKTESPEDVWYGFSKKDEDEEGRIITLFFKNFVLINCYFPNGGGGPHRLEYKLDFYEKFLAHIEKIKKTGREIIFCGDINTAHHEIDLARPKENEKNTGFLPIERAWLDKITSLKYEYVDTFRYLFPEKVSYTWWDMKTRARDRNIGWRIDYFFVSKNLAKKINSVKVHDNIFGSDHCPIELEINLN